jgi:uncharacterized protein (DUF58 family)
VNPELTENGRWILAGALALLVCGMLVQSPRLVLMSCSALIILFLAFHRATQSAWVLDRGSLGLLWPEGNAVPLRGAVGECLETSILVVNRSARALHGVELSAVFFDGDSQVTVALIPFMSSQKTLEHLLSVRPTRPGSWLMHGCDVIVREPWSMFQVRDYLPCPREIRVLPALGGRRAPESVPSRFLEGPVDARSRGNASSIRELRDYAPSDPLRSVAWKATLRTGRLIVREYDSENIDEIIIALDISNTMRGGPSDARKFDLAITLTAEMAMAAQEKGNTVGLMTFEEKLCSHIPPRSGEEHVQELLGHVLELQRLPDADLSELDEAQLENLLCRYLLLQYRVDLRDGAGRLDTVKWQRWRKRHPDDVTSNGFEDDVSQQIRLFLHGHGVPIPFRLEARIGVKERGLLHVLLELQNCYSPLPRLIVVTDLCGILHVKGFLKALQRAKELGVEIRFVVPFTPWLYKGVEKSAAGRLFAADEWAEREAIAERIRAFGFRVDFF